MKKLFALLGVTVLGASLASAATSASGTISNAVNGSNWDYTINLTNTGTTTIDAFWFGWIPDINFMTTIPSNIVSPSNWTGVSTNAGPGDGYGIQWLTATAPLGTGASATFKFTSGTSPTIMNGQSPLYSGIYATTTSYVYQGAVYPGTSPFGVLTLTAVPEPTTVAGLAMGAALLFARRRRARI